jgi:glycosyltransferase involved in cell wall biosynthesis
MEEKMTFHVIGLPHTQCTKEFVSCAYTQKVLNFCKMMHSLGHDVYHYGGEGSTPECTEHISIITNEEREKWWGGNDTKKEFYAIEWTIDKPYWQRANRRAIEEIGKRIQKKDFICVIAGSCHKPVADAFPNHMTVEFGIGYEGTFSKYRVFESYAWMHHVYGIQGTRNGQNYDTVIPNYYDPMDFSISESKGDYYLFIGRLIARKGPHIAGEVCQRLGAKLKIAGQGVTDFKNGEYVKSLEIKIDCKDIEYVGTVGVEERKKLMSEAKAVFVQTQYIGPFEGVHAEAMLSGTPVITTDWGVFSETVIDGFNGFRTRTLGEAIWATKESSKLNPQAIREHAISKYSIDVVKYRYQDYFKQLLGLWGKGWYEEDYDPTDKRVLGNFK